jgi:hypothetical protein
MLNKNSMTGIVILCLFFFARAALADVRLENFTKSSIARQYIALGGNYKSDENSKDYDISAGYKYRSDKFIHEFEFLNQVDYAEVTKRVDSKTSVKVMTKKKELYDAELSSKMLIANSNNYFNFYNRSKYDELSTYYYDVTTVLGLGRILSENFEADLNIGHNDVKNFNSEMVVNPTLRAKFDLTDKITFITRGYIFQRENTYDEQLRSRLAFRMDNKISLEFIHSYEKNRDYDEKTRSTANKIERSVAVRIKYDF